MAGNVNLCDATLLLTRPKAAASRFRRQAEAAFGEFARVVTSPLMEISPLRIDEPPGEAEEIIFSSVNGVEAMGPPTTPGMSVWCVGGQTAARAQDAGYVVRAFAPSILELEELLIGSEELGPFAHVAGRHRHGDLVNALVLAGVTARSIDAYDQVARPLSADAKTLLQTRTDIVAPIFSPRTGRLLLTAARSRTARVHVVAISENAGTAWKTAPGERFAVAPSPDVEGILFAMGRLFDADPLLEAIPAPS